MQGVAVARSASAVAARASIPQSTDAVIGSMSSSAQTLVVPNTTTTNTVTTLQSIASLCAFRGTDCHATAPSMSIAAANTAALILPRLTLET